MKLLILLALTAFAVARIYKIPLTRFESTKMKMMKNGTWKDHVMEQEALRATAHKNRKTHIQLLHTFDDIEYVANITIGTPPQLFTVLPNTASANLWVPDITCIDYAPPKCEQCQQSGPMCQVFCDVLTRGNSANDGNAKGVSPINLESECHGKRKFNQHMSSTYAVNGTKFLVSYGSSYASGFLGRDTVRFGVKSEQVDPLTVSRVTFGQATEISSIFQKLPFDGILGLAFPSLAFDGVTPPFFEAMKQNLVDPIFTAYFLGRGFVRDLYGGLFTYGGIDNENCGFIIAYQNLSFAGFFQFHLKSVKLGTFETEVGWEVISDTSSSAIMGPQEDIEKIANVSGAKYDSELQCYSIKCSAFPGFLQFGIGNNTLGVSPKYYIVQVEKGVCCLALVPVFGTGFGFQWTFGYPFLRAFCTIYDFKNKRIGFARPKQP